MFPLALRFNVSLALRFNDCMNHEYAGPYNHSNNKMICMDPQTVVRIMSRPNRLRLRAINCPVRYNKLLHDAPWLNKSLGPPSRKLMPVCGLAGPERPVLRYLYCVYIYTYTYMQKHIQTDIPAHVCM